MLQDELIRDLVIEIFLEDKNQKYSEYHIHKILYQYKVDIRKTEPLSANKLPFYWYLHGVYSEPVRNVINALVDQRILIRSGYTSLSGHEGSLFALNTINLGLFKPKIKPRMVDELYRVVKRFNKMKGEQFSKTIYEKYAPFKFQLAYNKKYLELLTDINIVDVKVFNRQLMELRNALCESEAELPVEEPLFDEFNDRFITYVTATNRLLRYYENGGTNRSYIHHILIPMSRRLWKIFVEGVRIDPRGYDSFYEDDIDKWKAIYEADIAGLPLEIKKYEKDILKAVGEKGLTKVESPSGKQFLSDVIGGYFSQD